MHLSYGGAAACLILGLPNVDAEDGTVAERDDFELLGGDQSESRNLSADSGALLAEGLKGDFFSQSTLSEDALPSLEITGQTNANDISRQPPASEKIGTKATSTDVAAPRADTNDSKESAKRADTKNDAGSADAKPLTDSPVPKVAAADTPTSPVLGGLLKTDLLAGALSGIPGGLVYAETNALANRRLYPTLREAGDSVTNFSMVGGLLGLPGTLAGKPLLTNPFVPAKAP